MPVNLSFTHLMVVAFVALVVLGPDRLPGVARTAGQLYREWQRISGGLQAEVRDALSEFTEPFTDPVKDILHGPMSGGGLGAAAAAAAVVGSANGSAVPPLASLPPLGSLPDGPSGAAAAGPLTPAIPALGRSTGLVSAGPSLAVTLPVLAPPREPNTFVPFNPGTSAGDS